MRALAAVRRALRDSVLRRLFLVVAVAAGLALATAVNIALGSIDRSAVEFSRDLAGDAPISVSGVATTGAMTPDLVRIVRDTPGVGAVRPTIRVLTTVAGPSGNLVDVLVLGVDCSVPELRERGCTDAALSALGDQPLAVGPAVVASAASGGSVPSGWRLQTDLGDQALDATRVESGLRRFNGGRVVLLSTDAAAKAFTRPVGVDAVGVVPDGAVSVHQLEARLTARLGDRAEVASADEPPVELGVALAGFVPTTRLVGLISLGISGVLVFSVVRMSVEHQRLRRAILSAVGAAPGSLTRSALIDLVVAGLAGGVLGVAGGSLMAVPMLESFARLTRRAGGFDPHLQVDAPTLALGVALGVVTVVAAGVVPLVAAARAPIVAELQHRATRDEVTGRRSWRRLLVWFTVAGLASVALIATVRDGGRHSWQAQLAFPALALLAVALLLSAQQCSVFVSRWLRPLVARIGGPVWLARENFERNALRSGATVVAVASAVGLALAIGSLSRSVQAAVERNTPTSEQVSSWRGRASSEFLTSARSIVGSSGLDQASTILEGRDPDDLRAIVFSDAPVGAFPVIDGAIDVEAFRRGEVVVGVSLARRDDVAVGDTVTLRGPLGAEPHRVMAIWEDGAMNGNVVGANRAVGARLFGELSPGRPVWSSGGRYTDADLRRRLAAVPGADRLVLVTRAERVERMADEIRRQMSVFVVVQRCLLLSVLAAVVTTLVLGGLQRTREMGLLGAIGMSPGELRAAVVAEGAIAGVVGSLLGLAAGSWIAWGMLQALPFLVGFRDPVVLDPWSGLAAAPVAVLVAVVGAALPALRAGRLEVVRAIATE